jgi:PKD repeat protein
VTDLGGNTATDEITITVLDITNPTAVIDHPVTVGDAAICTFDGSGSYDNVEIVNYRWEFGDGNTYEDLHANVTHIYGLPGNYIVNLTVTDTSGLSHMSSSLIVVTDITFPVADAGSDDTTDEDTVYMFNASGSMDNAGIAYYNWSFGDGSESLGTEIYPEHVYDHPGVYTVTLSVTDPGGNTAIDEITITVLDITNPTAVINHPLTIGDTVPCPFEGSGSYDNVEIVSYRWECGDGNTYEGMHANITHIYSRPGNYTVNLTVMDTSGLSHTSSSLITVMDMTPPQTPKGLKINKKEEGEALMISWDGVPDDDLDHYELYYSENNGQFTKMNELGPDEVSITLSGLINGYKYAYYLIAVDESGNPSSPSGIVEGVPDTDSDRDGIFDADDFDDDNDSLADELEVFAGTDPLNPDSDGDTYIDGEDVEPMDPKKWHASHTISPADTEPENSNMLFTLLIIIFIVIATILVILLVLRRRKTKGTQSPQEEQIKWEVTPAEPAPSQAPPPPTRKILPPPPPRK